MHLPVDWVGLPPDISITISSAVSCLFKRFFDKIYLIGIFPLLPSFISGMSAPLIQKTFSILLAITFSFPQSPFKVEIISSENVPVDHLKFSGLLIKYFLNIA